MLPVHLEMRIAGERARGLMLWVTSMPIALQRIVMGTYCSNSASVVRRAVGVGIASVCASVQKVARAAPLPSWRPLSHCVPGMQCFSIHHMDNLNLQRHRGSRGSRSRDGRWKMGSSE